MPDPADVRRRAADPLELLGYLRRGTRRQRRRYGRGKSLVIPRIDLGRSKRQRKINGGRTRVSWGRNVDDMVEWIKCEYSKGIIDRAGQFFSVSWRLAEKKRKK